jgi:hypothetical protein
MSLRKITKNRGSFPSDEALMKLFYLALRNISRKWTMPIRDWKAALTRFTIQFEDRMTTSNQNPVYTKFGTPSPLSAPPSKLALMTRRPRDALRNFPDAGQS